MSAMDVEEKAPEPAAADAPVPMDAEEEEEQKEETTYPNMELAQRVFTLDCPEPPENAAEIQQTVLDDVRQDSMAPYYETLCSRFGWPVDDAFLGAMKTANEEALTKLTEGLDDAEKNHGETEVLDALFAIAQFHARIGDKSAAYVAFDVIVDKPKVSTGKKIDASMQKLRVALFYMDTDTARKLLVSAKKLVDDGGDWDRRNRLKVYEAHFLMVERDFKAAAELLLEGVATFTCTELCSYETFIFYAVVTNLLYLKRPDLKKKIVDGPEVLSVLHTLPPLPVMANGLYDCEYEGFFEALVTLNTIMLRDRYLSRHARYLVREFRILVYTQFLEAFKSVRIDSMANAFGVTTEFLDGELSRFIATNRLNAKIDKVGGMVETNRPDQKNAQYQSVIKKGDLLLNQIQKLARVIDV